MKKYYMLLPEFILLGLSAYWFLENFLSSNHFNSFAFIIFAVLFLQVFFQNKYLGFSLATLVSFISLYMVLAVISEFRDFHGITTEAVQLLGFGILLCSLGIGSALMMFYKFLPKVF